MITNLRYFDCQMNSHKGKDNKCVHSHICQSIDPFIKNWIIGSCNSRVSIGLAIMGYEPSYNKLSYTHILIGSHL